MAETVKTFDFDIQPGTLEVTRSIPPDGEAEVTFQVCNTGDRRQRAEVILQPVSGPLGQDNLEGWPCWLHLVEPAEYDYQPKSHRDFTVKIQVGSTVTEGQYSFKMAVVGHDDPDRQYMDSLPVSFKVARPPFNKRPFIIGGIIFLVLLVAGIITAILLTKPPKAVTTKWLDPPKEAVVGQPVIYSLQLTNSMKNTPVDNVVFDYVYPSHVQAAWAEVITNQAGAPVPFCGSTGDMLRCALGSLPPSQVVTLKIHVLPGPLYSSPVIPTPVPTRPLTPVAGKTITPALPVSQKVTIDNTGAFSLRWFENGVYQENLDFAEKPIVVKPVDPSVVVSGAAVPVVNIAPVGLPVKISLVGWNNAAKGALLDLVYTLPRGMRFSSYPKECTQQKGNYFLLKCTAISQVPVEIYVIPMQPSAGYLQQLSGSKRGDAVYYQLPQIGSPALPAENNQLVFDGMSDWAQLGYSAMPESFTVETWVNPASIEDGQALIGLHTHSALGKDVINRFLVGYYNGGLDVNVMGYCQTELKPWANDDPFHLAVVVKGSQNSDQKTVTLYKNGVSVDLTGKNCCRKDCQAPLSGDEVDFDWVIGQDWDPNGSGIVTSDFFAGALSDVRIYNTTREPSQILEEMYLPPAFCSPEEMESCPLQGWWQLAPSTSPASAQHADCRLDRQGQLDLPEGGISSPACILSDLGPHAYAGARSGGTYEGTGAGYGQALAFDGKSVVYNKQLLFSDFSPEKDGLVPVTISAWIYVDALPSRPQIILAELFYPNLDSRYVGASVELLIDAGGHVVGRFSQIYTSGSLVSNPMEMKGTTFEVRDEKTIPAGHWINYALVLWYNPKEGSLENPLGQVPLLLFRDAELVKEKGEAKEWLPITQAMISPGFYLGGYRTAAAKLGDPIEIIAPFTGRLDEVRIWNRALYGPEDVKNNFSSEIDLWRRLPGTAFDEYVYWSFDDRLGKNIQGPCLEKICTPREYILDISGPSWVFNDLKAGFTIEMLK